jgi:hypothetical protein
MRAGSVAMSDALVDVAACCTVAGSEGEGVACLVSSESAGADIAEVGWKK